MTNVPQADLDFHVSLLQLSAFSKIPKQVEEEPIDDREERTALRELETVSEQLAG